MHTYTCPFAPLHTILSILYFCNYPYYYTIVDVNLYNAINTSVVSIVLSLLCLSFLGCDIRTHAHAHDNL